MKKTYSIIFALISIPLVILGTASRSFVKRNHIQRITNKTDGRIRITVNTTGNKWGWYPQTEELEPGEQKDINVYAWCIISFHVEGMGGLVEEKTGKYEFQKPQCASYLVDVVFERTRLNPTKIVQIKFKKLAEHR